MSKPTGKESSAKADRGEVDGTAPLDEFRAEEERAAALLGEDWRERTLSYIDICLAIRRFRKSFDEALEALDRYVDENDRLSKELREAGCEFMARVRAIDAARYADVTTPVFHKAASGMVELIEQALTLGYPDHVLKVERPLMAHGSAEWARLCTASQAALILYADDKQQSRSTASDLIRRLKTIDERATTLSVEYVVQQGGKPRIEGPGFAAALACACGAFDYRPDDQEKAQRAFAKALGRLRERARALHLGRRRRAR